MKKNFVPNKIDKSVFVLIEKVSDEKVSNIEAGQLVGAFRFLGLISEDGAPTKTLRSLVATTGEIELDRDSLRQVIMKAYPEVFDKIDISQATHAQLEDAMRVYGISGTTLLKAKAFFLLSLFWTGIERSPELWRRRPKSKGVMRGFPGESKTVSLKSGGHLYLSVTEKIMDLDREDRDFILSLIDRLRDYEKGAKLDA